MNYLDKKNDVLNKIAALKSINTDFPKLKKGKSLPSFKNKADVIQFIKDLIDIIVGVEEFKDELVSYLTYLSPVIETNLKDGLKVLLKSKFSCSIDAKIPDFLLEGTGIGFNVAVSQVDFSKILKVNPETAAGTLIYGSIPQDLNAYLYSVLQGNSGNWKNLIKVTYLPQGLVDGKMKTHVFNVKIDSTWNNRTVNDFINKFLDSVIIFTLPVFITRIFEIIYGTASKLLKRNRDSVSADVELEIFVQKIIDLPDTEINNSYFEFSKDEIDYFNERLEEKISGSIILKECNFVSSTISVDQLLDLANQLSTTTNFVEIKEILENKLTILSEEATDGLDESNKPIGKKTFFNKFLIGLLKALVNLLFAPKMMMMIVTYFKVVSNTIGFTNFKEFLNENRQFIIDLVKKVVIPIVIKFLMKILIKHLSKLVAKEAQEKILEKIKNQKIQIQSLLGLNNISTTDLTTLLTGLV
jgi:hypothetical protein